MPRDSLIEECWSQWEEVKKLITETKIGVLSPATEIRTFKKSVGSLLNSLRNKMRGISQSFDQQTASLFLNVDIVEIEYACALSRANPENNQRSTYINKKSAEILDRYGSALPEDVRMELLVTGIGAAIDEPDARNSWILRVRHHIENETHSRHGNNALAYNLVTALGVQGSLDDAIEYAALLDNAIPDAILLQAGLLAHNNEIRPSLYTINTYFQEQAESQDVFLAQLEQALTMYLNPRRALALLAIGHQGMYAIIWAKGDISSPIYIPLIGWMENKALCDECSRLPWARFLNRNATSEVSTLRFQRKDYHLLQHIWYMIMNPIFKICGDNIDGIDIMPMGWLALIPWTACGEDPSQGQYVGGNVSFATIPNFRTLSRSENILNECRRGNFFVRGSYENIEAPCEEEEASFREMGFEVIESRSDIFRALRVGRIVHFSGHGYFPPLLERDTVAHFVMSDGLALTLQDFHNECFENTPPIVSFSSCELGFYYLSQGNIAGFPGFFLSKGSATCIAPLGEINAKIAAKYFPALYQNLLSGHSISYSARSALARRTTSRQGERNIGLWAPFFIFGNQWACLPTS